MRPELDTAFTKTCITCNTEKSRSEFWKQKSNSDGLFGECKKCSAKRNLKWTRKNKVYAAKKINIFTRRRRLADPKKALFFGAKHRAKKKGITFDLNPDDFIIPQFCPILGIPLKTTTGTGAKKRGNGNWNDNSPSLDRIDNLRGYTKDNVVIVSVRANRIKSNASVEELRAIYEWYNSLQNGRRISPAPDTIKTSNVRKSQNHMPSMLGVAAKEER